MAKKCDKNKKVERRKRAVEPRCRKAASRSRASPYKTGKSVKNEPCPIDTAKGVSRADLDKAEKHLLCLGHGLRPIK